MLDHRYGQIVMAASDPGDLAWASGAKHCLIIASDAHSVPSAVTTTLRRVGQFGGQASVIATGLHNAPSVGHLRSLGMRLGTHVLCGLTRPLFALAEEGLPPLIRRERGGGVAAAIGWLARHLLGCKVGLALGAGSARGFAHLGVLQVFEREGIPVDVLTGTSIGAIIAGAWATGMRIDTIARILHDAGSKLLAPTVPYASLFSNRNVRVALVRMVGETRIDDLPIPYAAVAVDLHTRSPVVLHEGFLRKAMLASAAIPGIFPPVLHEGHVLIDGALRNPLPTDVAADLGADRVIGVRLSPTPLGQVEAMATNATRKDSLLDVVLTMLDAMQEAIEASCGHNASLVIHPALAKVPLRQFNTGAALMETGARATEAALPTLRTLLPWLDRSRSPTFT